MAFKSKNYPNLYRMDGHSGWVFRKYASAKHKQFVHTTGIENESKAYAEGLKRFNDWMAGVMPSGPGTTIGGIARAIMTEKRGRPDTMRSRNRHLKDHIIPEFGYLRPDQVSADHWRRYDEHEREKGRNSLYNDRKYLIECLMRAVERKLIPSIPKLPNNDPKAEPPRALNYQEYRSLRHELPSKINLLVFVMYWQGARPGEIMKYRWDMINWETKKISIPASITKTKRPRTIRLNPAVYRAFKWLHARSKSPWVFPSPKMPGQHMYAYSTVWGKAIEALKRAGKPHDFHLYCLRDSFITRSIVAGHSPIFVGRYCDTSSKEIEKRYCGPDEESMDRIAGMKKLGQGLDRKNVMSLKHKGNK